MSKGIYNASMQIEMENMFFKILLFQFLRKRKLDTRGTLQNLLLYGIFENNYRVKGRNLHLKSIRKFSSLNVFAMV